MANSGHDPHYGLPKPPSAAEGRWLPPDIVANAARARMPAQPTVSVARRILRILRAWPRLLGTVGAIMIVYYATPASKSHASERGGGIAMGVGLLVVAAVVLALRRLRFRSQRERQSARR